MRQDTRSATGQQDLEDLSTSEIRNKGLSEHVSEGLFFFR